MTTNIPSDQISDARNLLNKSQSILIATQANPTIDSLAVSLSLYLSLSAAGKQVKVVCPSPMLVEFNRLIGVDKVTININSNGTGRNLVISFPYEEGSIEKVSYNIEGNLFNLVIEPREGFPTITPEMVQYSFGGGNTEVILTIGAQNLENLGNLYNLNQPLFQQKPIINIDINSQNRRFGKVNIINQGVSSISESFVFLLSQLGLSLDGDMATNLLFGITEGSNNFSPQNTTAATFEAAAICLRNGAKKSVQPSPQYPAQVISPPVFPKQSKYSSFPKQQMNTIPLSSPIHSQTRFKSQQKNPSPLPTYPSQPQESTHPETPPDWLKPKIYKGSTLL